MSGGWEADAYWGQEKMEAELKLWAGGVGWDWRDDSISSQPAPLPPTWAAASFILLSLKGGKYLHLGWESGETDLQD